MSDHEKKIVEANWSVFYRLIQEEGEHVNQGQDHQKGWMKAQCLFDGGGQ